MAEEILDALDGKIDEFVMGVGTGGCFSGNAEVLKERVPNVRCIALEPAESRALSDRKPFGGHRLEGMGPGFVPSICRLDLADEIIPVTDAVAYETARRLAREEGIFGGITSGCNVWATLERARQLGPGHRVVTVIVDSGLKYLRGDLYEEGKEER
jgi:cysteine synthase A